MPRFENDVRAVAQRVPQPPPSHRPPFPSPAALMPRRSRDHASPLQVKLDFKDVLIRPKRSTLKSRSEVDLVREFTFRNSKRTWSGIPIMAANM